MKKVFRALGAEVVEKKFIGDLQSLPEGWFESPAEAMARWVEPAPPEPGATADAAALALEEVVDLDDVTGTGRGGRITVGDVRDFIYARDEKEKLKEKAYEEG